MSASSRTRGPIRHVRRALVLLALACASAADAAPAPVFVEATENGQGLLRERNGECFVVTPKHVVEGSGDVTVVAAGRLEAAGRLDTTFTEDVAILRVVDRGRFACGAPWDEAHGLEAVLGEALDGVLVTTTATGAVQRRFVRIVGWAHGSIRVRPATDGDALFQTLSGGLLEIGGRPAGMLLSVDATSGAGTVLRMDHVSGIVRGFFDVRPADALATASGYTLRPLRFRAMAAERTRIFEQPDRMSATLATLDVGQTFEVTGQVNERLWFRIEHQGVVGFVPTTAAKRL